MRRSRAGEGVGKGSPPSGVAPEPSPGGRLSFASLSSPSASPQQVDRAAEASSFDEAEEEAHRQAEAAATPSPEPSAPPAVPSQPTGTARSEHAETARSEHAETARSEHAETATAAASSPQEARPDALLPGAAPAAPPSPAASPPRAEAPPMRPVVDAQTAPHGLPPLRGSVAPSRDGPMALEDFLDASVSDASLGTTPGRAAGMTAREQALAAMGVL